MLRKYRFTVILVIVALVLLVSQSTGTFAQGVGGDDPLSVGAAEGSASQAASPISWYEAPITPPNGVTITQMVVYFYDNSSETLTAMLDRCPLAGEGCDYVAGSVSSSGAVNGVRSMASTATYGQVTNLAAYTYMVQISMGPGINLRILGVRIDYVGGYFSLSPFEFTPYVSPTFPGIYPYYYLQGMYNPGYSNTSSLPSIFR